MEQTDQQLVHMALQHADAFVHLVHRYEAPLRRYIIRISGVSREDCEDMLQEVFINIYKNLRGYDPSLSFSSWAYRITHNYVRSQFRKKKARPVETDIDTTILENFADHTRLEEELDTLLSNERLKAALDSLDPKYRDVLVLKFLEEKEYTEISDIMQKPMGSIATLVHRAKKKLKEELVSKHPSTPDV